MFSDDDLKAIFFALIFGLALIPLSFHVCSVVT